MLINLLKEIEDPRSYHGKEYQLWQVLLISILAIMCNAKTYVDISTFMRVNYDLLNRHLQLKWRRTPTHSCIQKIFTRLTVESVESAFRNYATALESQCDSEELLHLAFDGKTLRGSASNAKATKAHQVLSAFSSFSNFIMAHFQVGDDKDHEIPALQKLIEELSLNGKIHTADALHCQKKLLR